MKIDFKVSPISTFPMRIEVEIDNMDELTMWTVACEYPSYQDILNGNKKFEAFAKRPFPAMTLPEWIKEIEFENGNVKKQVIRLLNHLKLTLSYSER